MTQYAQPYGAQTHYSQPYADYPSQPQQFPPIPAAPPTPPKASVLPVVSLVIALMALVGVVAVGLGLAAFSGAESGGGSGSDAPLTGQLGTVPSGALRGADLAAEVTDVIADGWGDAADLRCPDTPAVGQDVTTVCHGTIGGEAWAVVVFFEDRDGRFTLLPV